MTGSSPRRWWLLMVGCAVCYFSLFAFFPRLLPRFGVIYFGLWNLDMYAILASNDAVTAGISPYVHNPFDLLHRPHVYSHWWLWLRHLGLTRFDTAWIGFTLVAAFFAGAVAWLRPRSPREMLWYLVVLCSSPVLLAIHRANNDLVVFLLLLPVVPCLLARNRLARLLSGPFVALAAGLKFYPAVAGLAILGGTETSQEKRRTLMVAVISLAFVALSVAPDLVRVGPILPKAEGLMTFGVVNLVNRDGRLTTLCALAAAALIALVFVRSSLFGNWKISDAERPDWLRFVLGASLLVGCYLTSRNFGYRWIFAIWLAPWLWRIMYAPDIPRKLQRFARLTAALLLIALWFDPMVGMVLTSLVGKIPDLTIELWANRIFWCEQPFTAAVFVCLIGWLAYFTLEETKPLFRRSES